MRESTNPTVDVQVSVYSVCALPQGHRDARYSTITVERHDDRRWAVLYRLDGTWLNAAGEWDDKPHGWARDTARRRWYARHTFPLSVALEQAKQAAAALTVNGATVADVLAAGR